MSRSLLDKDFRYLGSATHADPMEFRRRMRARAAAIKAAADAAKAGKVQSITQRKAAK